MHIAITCPDCRHRGHIAPDMLPCSLKCSRCGGRAEFERGGSLYGATNRPLHPSFTKHAQLPDLLRELWGEQG
jgi:hypothetical protein